MSLDAILRTALSGLNTNQSALRTTSQNIANVNTPGYARQEVILQSASSGGQSMGVEIGEVRRIVDTFLTKELIGASAYNGYYEKQTQLYDRLVSLFGSPDDTSSLNNQVDQLFDSFASLATDATQTPRRIGLLSDMQNVAESLNRYGRQILNLRSEADSQIVGEIAILNNALSQVHTLNGLISREKETGGNPAALEEQRARAIESISDIVDIRAVERANYKVDISTISGLSLLDDRLRVVQYNPPGQVETTVVFNSITVHQVDSNTGLASATGVALEPSLRAGTLKGLVDMRDKELPEVALNLGELSSKFVDLINQVHNENSAVPPPNVLTGRNVGALATDAHGFTGKVTFGILDSSNILTSSYEIDFGSSSLVTLQDVITDVNANITGGTLALTNGVMSFTASTSTDGVAISQNTTTPSARGGRGFSQYFGMNDLMSAREVSNFDTGLTTAAGHGFGSSGTVNMEFRGPGGVLAASYTLDFSTVGSTVANVLSDLNTAFSGYGVYSLDSNGKLVLTPATGYENFDMKVRTDTTARGGTAVPFSDYFGVGDHYRMDAAFNIKIDTAIMADTGKLALARLDTGAASGIPALNNGDNRGVNAFVALSASVSNFAAAGDLPATSTTLANYGNYFLSNIGLEADRLASLAEDRKTLRDELGIRRDNMTGINLDEELSAMVQYQNAYNAAARIIAAVNEMYDVLLRI